MYAFIYIYTYITRKWYNGGKRLVCGAGGEESGGLMVNFDGCEAMGFDERGEGGE